MDRNQLLDQVRYQKSPWDVIVVGGGATGLGTALDAASRGYRTLLLEQHDFGKGTSSRSTKLAHGGVRYLRQRDFGLVREALRERGLLMRNAPHLVRKRSFVIPAYSLKDRPYYAFGLKLYDLLAGKNGIGKSRHLDRASTIDLLPTISTRGLRGGIEYFDGQFDDSRLIITLAQSVADAGGVPLNYMKVERLLKKDNAVGGVVAIDQETGESFEVSGKVVINAAGIFSDVISQMDEAASNATLSYSRGTHIVLDSKLLPGESALMIPSTDDGRVLFAIPWHDRLLVGTTDVPVKDAPVEPRPDRSEVDFMSSHLKKYLMRGPTPSEIKSVFSGIRPLLRGGNAAKTSDLSRSHQVSVSRSGLVTITGGKWTTYRRMAEDAVEKAIVVGGLSKRPSVTKDLRLHGWTLVAARTSFRDVYGTDIQLIRAIEDEDPGLNEPVHVELPYRRSEIVWAVRHEMARTLEDTLARRTRSLVLDASASVEAAPTVARLMARELGKNDSWVNDQIKAYGELARGYILEM